MRITHSPDNVRDGATAQPNNFLHFQPSTPEPFSLVHMHDSNPSVNLPRTHQMLIAGFAIPLIAIAAPSANRDWWHTGTVQLDDSYVRAGFQPTSIKTRVVDAYMATKSAHHLRVPHKPRSGKFHRIGRPLSNLGYISDLVLIRSPPTEQDSQEYLEYRASMQTLSLVHRARMQQPGRAKHALSLPALATHNQVKV